MGVPMCTSESLFAVAHPRMETTNQDNRRHGEGELGIGGMEVTGTSDCVATVNVGSEDGGLDYKALIRQQQRELEELKRAAREASPSK